MPDTAQSATAAHTPTACTPQPPAPSRPARPSGMFDAAIYRAALAYWGLPADWPTIHPNGRGVAHCDARTASTSGKKVWAHVNLPCRDAPPKAALHQIAVVQNVSLDFEYAPDPTLAHTVGQRLAAWLVAEGIAAPGLAVEDSGAGVHIVVPLTPLRTAEYGGGERVNRAVAAVVQQMILPRFTHLVETCGGGAAFTLEGYDIARVLSVPGTWRPAGSKKDEAAHLTEGYLRRYLPPYDRFPPVRRESGPLRTLIVAACAAFPVSPPIYADVSVPRSPLAPDPMVWLDEYARRRSLPDDRSRAFQALVAAVFLRFDAATVQALAAEIDRLCGSKYGARVGIEAERSLDKARQLPKT